MANAELITALRQRSEAKESELTFAWLYETQGAMSKAADALEEANKRIAELSLDNKMLKNTIDADKGVMLDRIRFLEAQLPKDGEWMKSIRWYYQQPTRIVATTDGTTFMCRTTGKLCKNATEYGYCKQSVCTIDSARG